MNNKYILTICIFQAFLLISCNKKIDKSKQEISSQRQGVNILTDQQWEEDLDELYTLLKTEHRDIYHKTEPAEFERLYLEIKRNISSLSDHEIIIQLTRLAALTNDGHTRLSIPLQEGVGLGQAHSKTPMPSDSSLVFRHLPVQFYWFDDGLYILKATEKYQHLIGGKVLQFGDVLTSDALEKARLVSHYDNEYFYKLIAGSKLSVIEILSALSISSDTEEVELTIEQNNEIVKVTLSPFGRFTKSPFLDVKEEGITGTAILSRQNNSTSYWYEYIEDSKAIYLQLNQMNDSPDGPDLIRFIGNINSFIKSHEVNRIILDLRNNFGGNNVYSLSIVNLLIKNPELNKIGKFYTLIGRKTFSAAQYLVNDLRKWTNVIFVGEPTGASPNSYGDSMKKRLTNSNLTVRISTIYWRDSTSDETKEWVAPDIPVPNTASDFFNNKDGAFERCLNFKPSNELAETYKRLYQTGGMETAERLYLRVALDWGRSQEEISSVENKLVEWMSEDN